MRDTILVIAHLFMHYSKTYLSDLQNETPDFDQVALYRK